MRSCLAMRNWQNIENPDEARARFYVWRLRRFYRALIAYSLLVPFLFTINYMTYHDRWWAWWPTMVMGIILLFRGLSLIGRSRIWNDDWEERKVAEIMARKNRR